MATSATRADSWILLRALALALLAAGVYYPAAQAQFIWDDDTFFTRNPLMNSAEGLWKFWFSTAAPDYFPLVSTVLWLARRLWGLEPLGYHLINIGMHAASSVLLWSVLRQLNAPGAWFAALIFALHPVQVESVAWITQLKNTQSAFFYFLALHFYLRHEARGLARHYALALACFLLALLSKTSVVMLPVVLLLYHWWNRDAAPPALRRTAPFFVLAAALALVTIWFQYNSAGAHGERFALSFLERFINAGHVPGFYLSKLLVPWPLIFIYPRWQFAPDDATSYLPHAAWLALAVFLWRQRDAAWGRAAAFGLAYYVVSLFPVLGFFNIYFMLYSFVADHYQYIAMPGAAALLAAAGSGLWRRLPRRPPLLAAGVYTVCGGVAAALFVLAWQQQAIYQNAIVLWEDTLAKNPGAWIAHNNLGIELEAQNRPEEAAMHYRQCLQINPGYAIAHDNLGLILFKQGKREEAREAFATAVRHDPKLWHAHNNLGMTYVMERKFDTAAVHFREAIHLHPGNTEAHNNLGLILEQEGKYEEALEHMEKALADEKNAPQIHNNMGLLHFYSLKKPEAAAAHFRKALELKPQFEEAKKNLEKVLRQQPPPPSPAAAQ